MIITKIPLEAFIETLVDLYQKGAEYVDLRVVPEEGQDIIQILVRKEYVEDENNRFPPEDSTMIDLEDTTEALTITPLNNDTLNQLI